MSGRRKAPAEGSSSVDRLRYLLGVAAVVSYPPGLLFWFLIHPFARKWRRVGPAWTYFITFTVLALLGVLLFPIRRALLGKDLGTRWSLVALGSVFYAIAIGLGVAYRRHLSTRTLIGVPELSRTPGSGVLLREGIYGIVRHPRYLSAIFGGLGYALFVNYVGVYVLVVLAIPILFVITLLEERELVERFGEAYRQYQQDVPRFMPRAWKTR